MEDKKFKASKEQYSIEFQLFSQTKVVVICIINNQSKEVKFQDHHQFNDFRDESDIFLKDWKSFCKLIDYTFGKKPQNLELKEEKLQIVYQITVLGTTQVKRILFKLKRQLPPSQQITILKQKISSYEGQMHHLKNEVISLKQVNKQILARLSLVEQLLVQSKQTNNSYDYRQQQTPKIKVQNKPQFVQQKAVIEKGQDQIQENIRIALDVDPNSQNYNKFKIDTNKIVSLEEEYYQVYWKDPLPKKGIARASVKMSAKNHFSIGVLAQSERKNQYSFQNKKCVCLYTYFDGGFRGVYAEGKYTTLQWKMEVDEIIEITIDMTDRKVFIGIKAKKAAIEIDIETLLQKLQIKQRLYFFLEMYEKDNILEFLTS